MKSIPPEDFDSLVRSAPAEKAGGAPAVYQSMKHVIGEAGLSRGMKALLKLNQKGGFDCPSCAWPDPDGERSSFEFCENGAKAAASETTTKIIDSAFFDKYSVDELASHSDYWLEQQGRLTEPMLLKEGSRHYQSITWDEAFARIGGTLSSLPDPNEAIFYTSGRASNEAAFMYQLFTRAYGTNNLPDCSNMCHESSGLAMKDSIGVGKGTVSLHDLRTAELIIVVGQNPGTNHPRMLTTLQQAKEKGAKIISINPLREAGLVAFAHPQRVTELLGKKTPLADLFIPIHTNGDQALFKGVAKRIFEMSLNDPAVLDAVFIKGFAEGFNAYREHIQTLDWTEITSTAGVELETIDELARAFVASEKIISCWAMGLTQHRNAVATIQELANLHFLRGAIGKEGAGLCPVRGHSNVQGDRTMGICEHMPESFFDSLDKAFRITSPREGGFNAVQAIRAMRENPGKVFFALGGNFLSASPDTEYTGEALKNCKLTVQVSTKLNRSHLVTGNEAIILPCLGRSELDMQKSGAQWLTVENSMGIVHSSSGSLSPISKNLRSEVSIICGLASATLGKGSNIVWSDYAEDYGKIRSKIEEVIPGFDDFNVRGRQPGGFYLPNPVKQRVFNTGTGKANFTIHDLDVEKVQEGRLLLMTIRSHDQYNTTVYGLNDRYRGIKGERRIVFMNADDMKDRGLATEAVVDVHSYFGVEERVTRNYKAVPYDLPKGCIAMYFPEANVLVPLNHTAKGSDTPASKSIPVNVVKA